jgi:parallel beta-helix repeat protein
MNAGWTRGRRPIRRGLFAGGALGSVAALGVVGQLLSVGVSAPAADAVLAANASPTSVQTGRSHALRCGDTVKRDTTLTADLSNCRGTGLVLGADGITLDLNGHTITGAPEIGDASGILVIRRRDVHIIGPGLVHHFGTAVLLQHTTTSHVDQITVADNLHGVTVEGGSADTVFQVAATRNPEGIQFVGGDRQLAVLNTVGDSKTEGGRSFPTFLGIALVGQNTRSRVVGNDIHDVQSAGIFLGDADRNVVEANRMTDAGDGVVISPGSRNRISYNRIGYNALLGGPRRQRHAGIALTGGFGNVLDHNVIDQPAGNGIDLSSCKGDRDPCPPKHPLAIDTLVRGNVVRRAGGDGLAVKTGHSRRVRRTRLVGNRVDRSGDDGFDVRSATTTLERNVARLNSDYGIVAVRGVVDGGRNVASGNGHRPQCRRVRCH